MGFFDGLVFTEEGTPVETATIGSESFYVIDDAGFRRHVSAPAVDRVVLAQFVAQIEEHHDEASAAMLKLMGQDDLFTKAMVDSSLRKIDLNTIVEHPLPPDARQWLGMMGFRIIIDLHGEVVQVEMPAAPEEPDDEP